MQKGSDLFYNFELLWMKVFANAAHEIVGLLKCMFFGSHRNGFRIQV